MQHFGIGGVAVGASTATSTAVTAGIATAAGTGKATQEIWGNMRDSSWEGIERMYQNGEITQEQMNSYIMIRNLSDEEWQLVIEDYKKGNISKEEFEQIKQIREMPEDWTTLENGLKGLGYGVANGVWEGIQWYLGGMLAGETIVQGSKIVNSAIRVGTDTMFNTMDTPYRVLIEALTTGENINQIWTEQGGWASVLTSAGIGLMGSLGGEAFDVIKLKQIKRKVLERVDTAKSIQLSSLKDEYGKYISDTDIEQAFNSIHVFDSKEDMIRFCMKNFQETREVASRTAAFEWNGTIYLPPEVSIHDIIHESEHKLGEVLYRFDYCSGSWLQERGMNEAFTELIACRKSGEWGTSGYAKNVDAIVTIEYALSQNGIFDKLIEGYYTKNAEIYKNVLDNVAGDGFYQALAEQMNITINFDGSYSKVEIDMAYEEIKKLVNYFIQSSGLKEVFDYTW